MIELALIFQPVVDVMGQQQAAFNQADTFNGNHGDHMLEIFELATQAARDKAGETLSDAMQHAATRLAGMKENGSAQVYAHGLAAFAQQFSEQSISLDDLVYYVQGVLLENQKKSAKEVDIGASSDKKAGDVLKALIAGLAGWQKAEQEETQISLLDLSYLFDLGVAYMSAKARGGSKAKIIADAAISVSPLNDVLYRAESGRLAIQTLLETMQLN